MHSTRTLAWMLYSRERGAEEKAIMRQFLVRYSLAEGQLADLSKDAMVVLNSRWSASNSLSSLPVASPSVCRICCLALRLESLNLLMSICWTLPNGGGGCRVRRRVGRGHVGEGGGGGQKGKKVSCRVGHAHFYDRLFRTGSFQISTDGVAVVGVKADDEGD